MAVNETNWLAFGYEETAKPEYKEIILNHAKAAQSVYKPAPGNYLVDIDTTKEEYTFHRIEDPNLKLI
jgi:hypothetical protein